MILSALGAAFWVLLALARLEAFRRGGDPLFLLAAAPAALAGVRLVFRAGAVREAPLPRRAAAWAGAVLPLLLRGEGASPPAAWAAAAGGTLLSLWALWALGEAFGVAPARRGRIAEGGPYRLLRHPAYAGEALSALAFAAAHPSVRNLAVLLGILGLCAARARWEEEVLSADPDYAAYMGRVRWRMLPFVW